MAVGNVHEMFGEERVCSSEDMIADGQTHTDTVITVCHSPLSGVE